MPGRVFFRVVMFDGMFAERAVPGFTVGDDPSAGECQVEDPGDSEVNVEAGHLACGSFHTGGSPQRNGREMYTYPMGYSII